jgi:MEMO1 family protein
MRPRKLPPGWYPDTGEEVRAVLDRWESLKLEDRSFRSVIAPHAGWFFSGDLAFRAVSGLRTVDTVVVVGGHLRPGDPVMVWPESEFETPLGPVSADSELRSLITEKLRCTVDTASDNSVEVFLPVVAYLLPNARFIAFRAPPSSAASDLAYVLYEASRHAGRSVGVIGSTDLTHYGPAYGFAPRGTGQEAVRWVKNGNDARIIERMTAMDAEGVVKRALTESSACSPGAAATAMTFARSSGAEDAVVIGYATSYDKRPSDSFVGYVGVGFRPARTAVTRAVNGRTS